MMYKQSQLMLLGTSSIECMEAKNVIGNLSILCWS